MSSVIKDSFIKNDLTDKYGKIELSQGLLGECNNQLIVSRDTDSELCKSITKACIRDRLGREKHNLHWGLTEYYFKAKVKRLAIQKTGQYSAQQFN